MIPEKLVAAFRYNAGRSLGSFVRDFTPHSTKSVRTRLAIHYSNEANIKVTLMEELIMGKKTSPVSQFTTKFCAISLDTPAKAEAKKWLEKNGRDLDTYAVQMVRDGWKSSFSWDEYNDCFIASATMRESGHKNFDVCVTSRSDNMWDAMLLNYYKIYVLFTDQPLPTERPKDNWG